MLIRLVLIASLAWLAAADMQISLRGPSTPAGMACWTKMHPSANNPSPSNSSLPKLNQTQHDADSEIQKYCGALTSRISKINENSCKMCSNYYEAMAIKQWAIGIVNEFNKPDSPCGKFPVKAVETFCQDKLSSPKPTLSSSDSTKKSSTLIVIVVIVAIVILLIIILVAVYCLFARSGKKEQDSKAGSSGNKPTSGNVPLKSSIPKSKLDSANKSQIPGSSTGAKSNVPSAGKSKLASSGKSGVASGVKSAAGSQASRGAVGKSSAGNSNVTSTGTVRSKK